jgi:hypothetical protein
MADSPLKTSWGVCSEFSVLCQLACKGTRLLAVKMLAVRVHECLLNWQCCNWPAAEHSCQTERLPVEQYDIEQASTLMSFDAKHARML